MNSLSHINADNQAEMVDVSHKAITLRTASASSTLHFPQEVFSLIQGNEIQSKKGPVFHTAIIAGTMAAKNTANLIPLCHILPLESVKFKIEPSDDHTVKITCTVKATHKTGVEMEALTGASIAALTIYDMCKAVSHKIIIGETALLSKSGGKSDFNSKP